MYSSFRDNIWGADLADMQLLSKFNKGFRFLLCIINIYSKYVWFVPIKDKKGLVLLMLFKKFLELIWVHQEKLITEKNKF